MQRRDFTRLTEGWGAVSARLGRGIVARWKLIALLVPLAVLVVSASILIWPIDNQEGPYRRDPYRKYSTPSELTSLIKGQAINGDSVYLNEIRLSPGAKEDVYFARGANGHIMLVIAAVQPVSLPAKPVVANVKGVIQRLPARSKLIREWKLNKQQRELLAGQHYYIAAQEIRVRG